jgi:TrmH family RNA methyltransferase
MEITSVRSAPVSRARRLHKRAFREADRRFLAEGPQAVREALATPGAVVEVLATGDASRRHPELPGAAAAAGIPWHTASGAVMSELAGTVTPQGVVAICAMTTMTLSQVFEAGPRLVAVLAQVRDPGNAGTVIRVADAAGADAVVLTNASVDPFNPKCVRASAGSIFHLPVVAGAAIEDVVVGVREASLQLIAADGASGLSLTAGEVTSRLAAPTAWLFGNEAWGLPADILELTDLVAAVPIYGAAESLNLSTAAAVCLYASATAQRVGTADVRPRRA